MAHFLSTGPSSTGSAADPKPFRKEINDLVKDEKQFSLYIQALSKYLLDLYLFYVLNSSVQAKYTPGIKIKSTRSSRLAESMVCLTGLGERSRTVLATTVEFSPLGTVPTAVFSSLLGIDLTSSCLRYLCRSSLLNSPHCD